MGEAFPAIRYTVAVLLVGAALLTTIALRKSFHAAYYQTPFFFCAIVLSSWFGGFGSGICSTLLSIFVFDLFFAQPLYSPGFSPSDPFVIIMALPGALCGIVWMLFATGTTLNVPSLMGAIMAIGVATANRILLVTFANGESRAGKNAREAALSAGHTCLRPVLMTALAMIIGRLPMSLGLGEGGEQNAPLGRAVIGGLFVATFATLFFVPIVYSVLRHRDPKTLPAELEEEML